MFEKMVLSGAGRRDRRLSKFFVGSTLAYLVLAGSALAVSICISDPKLVGSSASTALRGVFPVVSASNQTAQPSSGARSASMRPNPYSVRTLDDVIRRPSPLPPNMNTSIDGPVDPHGAGPGQGDGTGGDSTIPGFGTGPGGGDPPPIPQAPKRMSQPAEVQHPRDTGPVRVSQPVLQGKATFRKTPDYPALARLVKKEGSVVVEVVISPEGRVESARAVSGDPLLAPTAVAAALEWRFQPTYLGNTPVRVAGAITFVFKLGQ